MRSLLSGIRGCFEYCEKKYKVKINPGKTSLFLKEARLCGKIYDGDGVKQEPEKLQGLWYLRSPNTVDELQQFLCGMNWLRGW